MGNSSSQIFRFINDDQEEDAIKLLEAQKTVDFVSNNGFSVQRLALEKGLSKLFKYCYLHNGVFVPGLEKNRNPLHRSVELGHYDFTWKLLQQTKIFKIIIDEQDLDGKTPLHIAVEAANSDIVALLIKYNARKDLKDFHGKTPYDIAFESKEFNMEGILEQFNMEDYLAKPSLDDISPIKDQVSTQVSKETKIEFEKSAKLFLLEKTLEESNVPIIRGEDLELMEIINKGSSCLVFKGKWRGTEVAVKQFTSEYSESDKKMKKFAKELQVLTQIRHPNLLLLMGICIDKPNLCLITELVPNFTLFYAIHKNKEKKLTLGERFFISTHLCKGIAYLHSNTPPIIHRDLKPENCLLDYNLNIKIADFGLARFASCFTQSEESMTTICIGTTRFMAPELFDNSRNGSIGIEVDIWALGCLIIEIFSNKRPWHYISSSKANSIFFEIFNKKPIPIPDNILPEVAEIIKDCCKYNPKKRPTANQVLERLEAAKNIYIIA
jgi:tRNA A-37 threonylcarbamoyl transferase component Bud32